MDMSVSLAYWLLHNKFVYPHRIHPLSLTVTIITDIGKKFVESKRKKQCLQKKRRSTLCSRRWRTSMELKRDV